MNHKNLRIYKHKLAAAACVLGVIILAASPVLLTDVNSLKIKLMGSTEVSWQDAMTGCMSLGIGWSLPSIYQLGAVYYRRSSVELIDKTDYWSHNAIAGFAFGLNTSRGIASFDRYADTDHFLCINSSN